MNTCKSCGIPIPEGQRFCSMCYGDPYYGKDGYYLQMLEYDLEQQRQQEQEEEQGE